MTEVRITRDMFGWCRWAYSTDEGTVVMHRKGFETRQQCVDDAYTAVPAPVVIVEDNVDAGS